MKVVSIEVEMHTASRVSTGRAQDGLDAVLDPNRIPSTSLKGVMRAASREILGLDETEVGKIFGAPGCPSAWAWNDLVLPDGPNREVTTRVRIPIDYESGTATEGGLFHAQELWLNGKHEFTIEQVAATDSADDQALLLAAAAMAVKGLGASRRRGMGWTTWRPSIDGHPVKPGRAVATVERHRGDAE